MTTFPYNFELKLPITFIGQTIEEDKVLLRFELSGFEMVGMNSPTVTLELDKNVLNNLQPHSVVMAVRRAMLTSIGNGLGLEGV